MNRHVFPSLASSSEERFVRVPITLQGRYMLRLREEFPCHTFEMSAAEAHIFAPVKPALGEKVVLYLTALGRFSGVATGITQAGFEMTLDLSVAKRARLADQLTWFANRAELELSEQRRHERIVPLNPITLVRMPWGSDRIAKIHSMSLSGVGLECDVWPALQSQVVVGKRAAIVVRHFEDGFACEFVEHFKPGELDESIRL